jgi:hypothetical protein
MMGQSDALLPTTLRFYVKAFYHHRLLKPLNIMINTRAPRQRHTCKDCGTPASKDKCKDKFKDKCKGFVNHRRHLQGAECILLLLFSSSSLI